MLAKIFIVVMLLLVIYSLGSALFYLINDRGQTERTVKALTWRIIFSIAVFALLMMAYYLGWIHPHGPIYKLHQ